MAAITKNTNNGGIGCFWAILGSALTLLGIFLFIFQTSFVSSDSAEAFVNDESQAPDFAWVINTLIQAVIALIGLWLLRFGNSKCKWLACSECGSKLPHKKVKLCANCKASFE